MKLFSIVGARPQFVKLAMICHALRRVAPSAEHRIVHTGQHYDAEMSAVFFRDLGIPEPDYHLEVGSGTHGAQTGEMIKRLEPILAEHHPAWTLLYGDTNSTLAGAVAGAKLNLRLAHIEAGLRSFNRAMPEEINRILTDHASDVLFCPTTAALRNLAREGLADRSLLGGDVMLDASLHYRRVAELRGGALADAWAPKSFALATVHRAENTDEPRLVQQIMSALERIARDICPVLFPIHPRTRKALSAAGIEPQHLRIIPPMSYLDMLLLEGRARFILTDSGGVQKEAYFARVPCITLRNETEWVETLGNRCNVLAGTRQEAILEAVENVCAAGPWTECYGDGEAAAFVAGALLERSLPSVSGAH